MKKPDVQKNSERYKSKAGFLVSGSISKALAVTLLDKHTRNAIQSFYTWYLHCEEVSCRHGSGGGVMGDTIGVLGLFPQFRSKTYSAIFEKKFIDEAFEGIEHAVNFYGWPVCVVLDVLNGFRMDVDHRGYHTIGELMSYCYHVAGSVFVGMAEILGVDVNDSWMMDRACDLGIAFQLTNIACHVLDDAKEGLVYLPAEFFLSGPATPDFILGLENRSAVIAATHVLLDLADKYYVSAGLAIGTLPWPSRCVTAMAAGSCRAIANRLRWSDDPWPIKQPSRFLTRLLNIISYFGQSIMSAISPLRFYPNRIDLWTRSVYLKNGN